MALSDRLHGLLSPLAALLAQWSGGLYVSSKGGAASNSRKKPLITASMANVYFLAVEWICFGCLHFASAKTAAAELPEFIRKLEIDLPIIIVTGFLEVAVGFAILFATARRFAAATSMILIVIYIPAVYTIIAKYNDLPTSSVLYTIFVIAMVPNNILLFISGQKVCRATQLQPFGIPKMHLPTLDWNFTGGEGTALIASLFLGSNIAGFVVIFANGRNIQLGTSSFWALMCLASGALIGFLFGVPKTSLDHDGSRKSILLTNTNIESISDWLTKILVGVGLINVQQIASSFHKVSTLLSTSIRSDEMYASGLIGYFSVLGVIEGYILTRIYLAERFTEHDPRFSPVGNAVVSPLEGEPSVGATDPQKPA